MLNLADYILHFFPFSNNIKTSGSWQILWMWILLWTPIGARTCDWLSIQKWGIIQFCETTGISWNFFLSLKFVSSTSSAVMGTPSSSNSCWKVRTGEIIERLILNWGDWIIATVNHTNKGRKVLKIQTRSEDSSITHSTSPVKDTSLGINWKMLYWEKSGLNRVLLPKNLSWEPWLLRDRPGHFWTLALPLRLGYNWTLETWKYWETFVMLHWTFFFDGCQN